MKLFTALFDLAVLPVVVVKDAFVALPDMSMGRQPFADTRAQCEKLDEDLAR